MRTITLPDVPVIVKTHDELADLIRKKTDLQTSPEFSTFLEESTSIQLSAFQFTAEDLFALTRYFDTYTAAFWGYNYDFILCQEAGFLLPQPLKSSCPIRYFIVPIVQWKIVRRNLACPALIWGLLAALFYRLMLVKSDIDLKKIIEIVFSPMPLSEMEQKVYDLFNEGVFDDIS